jgi:hypothetical protein
MVSQRPADPVANAMRVMRNLQAEREASIVVPGRGVDRLIARLLDAGVFGVLAYALTGFASLAGLSGGGEERSFRLTNEDGPLTYWGPTSLSLNVLGALATCVALLVLYEVLCHRYLGATPGKRRTQLLIVDAATLAPASAPRLLVRTLVWGVPLAFGILTLFHSIFYSWGSFAIVFAMYLWSRRDRAQGHPFWDFVARTRVITSEPPAP